MNKGESSHHSAQDIRVNMAKLSWMAYQAPEKVNRMWREEDEALENTNWSPLLATTEPVLYASCASCDAQAYAVKMDLCPRAPLVLACRGTSSIADAMIDASVQLVPFSFADGKSKGGVAVHRGFYKQFKGILPWVDPLYKGHLAGGGVLMCTGHSLGRYLLNFLPFQLFDTTCRLNAAATVLMRATDMRLPAAVGDAHTCTELAVLASQDALKHWCAANATVMHRLSRHPPLSGADFQLFKEFVQFTS